MDPVVLYTTPAWTSHITALLMLFAFPMFIATYFPGKISSTLKHPMLVAVKTWALGHLLANGMLADVLLFGGFLAWAVADRISLKRRTPRDIPACRRRASMTRSLLCWGWRSMWSSRSGCIRPGLVCPSSAEIVFVDQAAPGESAWARQACWCNRSSEIESCASRLFPRLSRQSGPCSRHCPHSSSRCARRALPERGRASCRCMALRYGWRTAPSNADSCSASPGRLDGGGDRPAGVNLWSPPESAAIPLACVQAELGAAENDRGRGRQNQGYGDRQRPKEEHGVQPPREG